MSRGGATVSPASRPILLVDDETPLREVLAEALADAGYVVLSAESGAAAMAILRAEPLIGLLITDVRMAGMSGLDLAKQARALRPDLGVILISGHFNAHIPPHRFLRKPFNLTELIDAVEAERRGTARA